jgi:hypothetical protein
MPLSERRMPFAVECRHRAGRGNGKGAPKVLRAVDGQGRDDLNSDRAGPDEYGTAYRIPGETSHTSQPRLRSTSMRRMRRMEQEP